MCFLAGWNAELALSLLSVIRVIVKAVNALDVIIDRRDLGSVFSRALWRLKANLYLARRIPIKANHKQASCGGRPQHFAIDAVLRTWFRAAYDRCALFEMTREAGRGFGGKCPGGWGHQCGGDNPTAGYQVHLSPWSCWKRISASLGPA